MNPRVPRMAVPVTLAACLGLAVAPLASGAAVNCGTSGSFNVNGTTVDAMSSCVGSVNIPAGVTTVNAYVFWSAPITDVTIPSSVTSIGGSAFGAATALTRFNVDPANATYASDSEGVLFDAAQATLIQYPLGRAATTYAIPGTVTTLDTNSFFMAPNLTSLRIPVNVLTIGYSALRNTPLLGSVTFDAPSHVQTIGRAAFVNSPIARISIPSSVTYIDRDAFQSTPNLARVYFEGTSPPARWSSGAPGRASEFQCAYVITCAPGAVGATAYVTADAVGWVGSSWDGMVLATYLPTPGTPTAIANGAEVAVSVVPATFGPAPTSYVVTAVEDPAHTCTVTPPATSCTISGLARGASYTFTATASTLSPVLASAASAQSNVVTLPADTPTPGPTPSSPGGAESADPTAGSSPATEASSAQRGLLALRTTPGTAMLTTTFIAPGPGIATQVATAASTRTRLTAQGTAICTARRVIAAAGRVTIGCRLTAAAVAARTHHSLHARVITTFTLADGTELAAARNVVLARVATRAAAARSGVVAVTG